VFCFFVLFCFVLFFVLCSYTLIDLYVLPVVGFLYFVTPAGTGKDVSHYSARIICGNMPS